mgnify:CR=1 FL=1
MSDRSNRDLGRKRDRQRHRKYCNCWLCMEDPIKKKIAEERANRKEIQRSLGYSRIGLKNI